MVRIKNYTLRQIIGEGATATVYRAVSDGNEEVAVKIIPKREKSIRMAHKEIEVLVGIKHENIIGILGQFESSRHIYVVEELCDINLISFLNEYEVDEDIALKVLRMVLCAVRHIHSLGIIHRDIKLGNVLLKGNTAKLCDFGLCCYLHDNNNTFCGTMDYIAPEIMNKEEYSSAVDMWSVGAVFYVLLTKRKFGMDLDVPRCSKDSKDLLSKLLEEDPSKRITAEDALRHRCFDRFTPCYRDYRSIPDFERITKHGTLKKTKERIRLNNVEVVSRRCSVVPRHKDPGCTCGGEVLYSVFVDDKPTTPKFLTNEELKTLSLISAYVKMIGEKTPKIIIEEDECRFYYTVSGDFVYTTKLFTLKKKGKGYEVIQDMDGRAEKRWYTEVPEFVDGNVYRLKDKCMSIDRDTCWSTRSSPILINCLAHHTLSMSCISHVSEISLKNRVVYKYMKEIGWCIKTSLNFMFLMVSGERFEVLGKDTVVVYSEQRFQINSRLPEILRRNLKKILPLLKKFLS